MVNTVLCAIMADSFAKMSAKIEGGAKPADVAKASLNEHWNIIFNGNGYGADWPAEAAKRGIPNLASCVDAIGALGQPKAVALFANLKDSAGISVMSADETACRMNVMYYQYCNVVELECLCMIDMVRQHVLPSALKAKQGLGSDAGAAKLTSAISTLEKKLHEMEKATEGAARAGLARTLRLDTMADVRAVCDAAESQIPPEMWTLATYKELLFLDKSYGADKTG